MRTNTHTYIYIYIRIYIYTYTYTYTYVRTYQIRHDRVPTLPTFSINTCDGSYNRSGGRKPT